MRYVVLLLALAACGMPDDSNNHGYGWTYDTVSHTGIRMRYRSPIIGPSDVFATDVSLYDRAWDEVRACTGLNAAPPFIVMVQFRTLGDVNGVPVGGRYFTRPSLIVLADGFVAKHEMVHYLLDVNVGDQDDGHQSDFFQSCVAFTVTP